MEILTLEQHPTKEVVEVYGFVKGSSVRAKNIGADFGASLKNVVGGEIASYRKLQDEARKIALSRVIHEAEIKGADAILGLRMVSTTITAGASEITVYGTAVKLKEEN